MRIRVFRDASVILELKQIVSQVFVARGWGVFVMVLRRNF
jgi:hypothetical protein